MFFSPWNVAFGPHMAGPSHHQLTMPGNKGTKQINEPDKDVVEFLSQQSASQSRNGASE